MARLLPHQPPMRLLAYVVSLARQGSGRWPPSEAESFIFVTLSHDPVVPAVILIEMLAQVATGAGAPNPGEEPRPLQLRVGGGSSSFSAARPGPVGASARVVVILGSTYRLAGDADGVIVASGSVTRRG